MQYFQAIRPVPVSRVIVAVLVLLSLLVGVGTAVAEHGDDSGRECPGENPNVGAERANESGIEHSATGFERALVATGCLP